MLHSDSVLFNDGEIKLSRETTSHGLVRKHTIYWKVGINGKFVMFLLQMCEVVIRLMKFWMKLMSVSWMKVGKLLVFICKYPCNLVEIHKVQNWTKTISDSSLFLTIFCSKTFLGLPQFILTTDFVILQ